MAETPPAEQAKRADPPTAGRDEEDLLRLRALRLRERGELIETACEAAAAIYRSRLGSGLPDVQPAPWPESTWQFLRRHAARVRSQWSVQIEFTGATGILPVLSRTHWRDASATPRAKSMWTAH